MSFYQAGTVSVAAGSTAVTAVGTVFEQQVKPGDTLMAGAVQALVKSVESNNALTLYFPWAGPTLTDLPDYVISHTGTGWYSTKDLNESVTNLIQRVELHLAGGDGGDGGGDPGGGDPGGGSGDTEAPGSPTGLSAVSGLDTGGRARVVWSWNANTSFDVLGYSLEVREVAGAALGNWVPQPDTQELHLDVTVPPGTVLDGRLRAFDKSLNYSPYSETVRVLASRDSTPPAIPTDITVMGVFNALFIKWTPAADTDLEATEIYLSTSATAPQLTTAPTYVQAGNATTIQNLPPGVNQYVSMRSRDTSGNRSAWTEPLLVVPRGLLTGEITAAVALIETAFIKSANIIEVDAVKIKAGSVLSSEVLVNNQTVGAIQAAAANPAAAINSGSTLIQPGKITVVGSWVMPGDTTKINGGMLSTNTVKASHIDTNSLAADAAFISNLKAKVLTAGSVGTTQLVVGDYGNIIQANGQNLAVIQNYANNPGGVINQQGATVNAQRLTPGSSLPSSLYLDSNADATLVNIHNRAFDPAARVNQNTTTINGGKITTNTLDASAILANSITADKIRAGAITADRIQAGSISADRLVVGGISFDRLASHAATYGTWSTAGGGGRCQLSVETGGDAVVIIFLSILNGAGSDKTVIAYRTDGRPIVNLTAHGYTGDFGNQTRFQQVNNADFGIDNNIPAGAGVYTYYADIPTNCTGRLVALSLKR